MAGIRIRDSSRKTGLEVIKIDLNSNVNRDNSLNRNLWMEIIHGEQANVADLNRSPEWA